VRFKTRKIAFQKNKDNNFVFYPMGFVEITIPEAPDDPSKPSVIQREKQKTKTGQADDSSSNSDDNDNPDQPSTPPSDESTVQLSPYRIQGAIDVKKRESIIVVVLDYDDLENVHTVKAIIEYLQDDGSSRQEEVRFPMHGYRSQLPEGTIVEAKLTQENHGKQKPITCKYEKILKK